MTTAKVFKSGNSQAVRLPKEFRLRAAEVQIFRRNDEIVLRERPLKLSELLARLPPLPDDFPDDIEDLPPQERDWSGWPGDAEHPKKPLRMRPPRRPSQPSVRKAARR